MFTEKGFRLFMRKRDGKSVNPFHDRRAGFKPARNRNHDMEKIHFQQFVLYIDL